MKKRTHTPQPYHPEAMAYNTDNAAIHIGEPSTSLKISRRTGLLCGRPAPEYKKLKRKVIYLRSALEKWVEDIPTYKNTAHASMHAEEVK